jgi:hypothetical protein
MAKQEHVPGGYYLNETAVRQHFVPGRGYLDQVGFNAWFDSIAEAAAAYDGADQRCGELIPGGPIFNETARRQHLVPGRGFVNDDARVLHTQINPARVTARPAASESTSAAHALSAEAVISKVLNEASTADDGEAAALEISTSASDGLAGADSTSALASWSDSTSDSVDPSDAAAAIGVVSAPYAEGLAPADVHAAAATLPSTLSETVAALDEEDAAVVMGSTSSDAAAAEDQHGAAAVCTDATSDPASASDDCARELQIDLAAADGASALDAATALAVYADAADEDLAADHASSDVVRPLADLVGGAVLDEVRYAQFFVPGLGFFNDLGRDRAYPGGYAVMAADVDDSATADDALDDAGGVYEGISETAAASDASESAATLETSNADAATAGYGFDPAIILPTELIAGAYLNEAGPRQHFIPGRGFVDETRAAIVTGDSTTASKDAAFSEDASADMAYEAFTAYHQAFVPGGFFLDESGSRQFFLPGKGFINDSGRSRTLQGAYVVLRGAFADALAPADVFDVVAALNAAWGESASAYDAPHFPGLSGLYGAMVPGAAAYGSAGADADGSLAASVSLENALLEVVSAADGLDTNHDFTFTILEQTTAADGQACTIIFAQSPRARRLVKVYSGGRVVEA